MEASLNLDLPSLETVQSSGQGKIPGGRKVGSPPLLIRYESLCVSRRDRRWGHAEATLEESRNSIGQGELS